jgi:hypothetical protein
MLRSGSTAQRWFWSKVGDTLIALACLGFRWFTVARHMFERNLHY